MLRVQEEGMVPTYHEADHCREGTLSDSLHKIKRETHYNDAHPALFNTRQQHDTEHQVSH
jgi:hypothetical protein